MICHRNQFVANIKTLKQLGYCRAVVANEIGVKLNTMNRWMLPVTSKNYNRCPKIAIVVTQDLIDKLSQKKP